MNPEPIGTATPATATPFGRSAISRNPSIAPARRTQGSLKRTSLNRQFLGHVAGGRAGSGRFADCVFFTKIKLQSRFAAITYWCSLVFYVLHLGDREKLVGWARCIFLLTPTHNSPRPNLHVTRMGKTHFSKYNSKTIFSFFVQFVLSRGETRKMFYLGPTLTYLIDDQQYWFLHFLSRERKGSATCIFLIFSGGSTCVCRPNRRWHTRKKAITIGNSVRTKTTPLFEAIECIPKRVTANTMPGVDSPTCWPVFVNDTKLTKQKEFVPT